VDIQGEYKIGLARQQVWNALQDAEILKQCIPGCQEMEKLSDAQYLATIVAAIGPVKATFKTNIEMQNLKPPQSYTLIGDAKGGAAGFGSGSAEISLSESAGATTLRYAAQLKVGGKLAQVGSRLVAGVTRKMADDFFGKFSLVLDKGAEKVVTEQDKIVAARSARRNRILAIAGAAAVVLIVLWLSLRN
jgi:carbon monoxide dehydrogenase subunit G